MTYPKDDYSRWDPHFQVGGPVLTDKMWFWAGYTPTMEDTNRTVTFRSNQQTGTYESKETTQNLVGNLTWQMSQPARLRVSGQYRPYDRDGLLPNPNGTNNPATVFAITSKQPNNTATGSFDYVGSNRVFFNTKVNYLEYDRHDNGIPNEIRYIFAAGSNNIYETRPNLIQSAGYTNILTNQLISKDKYSRIGWSGDSTFFVNAAGQHTFKGGVQFERIENDVANVEQQPNVIVRLEHIAHEPRWGRSTAGSTATTRGARSARSARSTSTTWGSSSRTPGPSTTG